MIQRLISASSAAYARWKYRLQKIGSNSVIGVPRLLEGASHISIGSNCLIRKAAWLGAFTKHPPSGSVDTKIMIENDVYIGFFACITSIQSVHICSGCLISDHFYASDHSHEHDPRNGSPRYQKLYSKGDVIIGKNCFVGYRVTIMPGVTLGEHCVVGAHSVVTHSFPANSMIAGVPARLLKTFNFQSGVWESSNEQTRR